MRRLVTLATLVVLLAALWTGGWFALAGWAKGKVPDALRRIADRGLSVECPARRIVGFPFALKLACGATIVAERQSGAKAQLAGVTGGASIFAPRTARIALASPAAIESPLLTAPAEFSWSDAHVDVAMNLSGPKGLAFDASDLAADLPAIALPGARVSAKSAEGALAPASGGGTDADAAWSALALTAAGATMPPFNGTLSVRLSASLKELLAGPAGLRPPLSATALTLALDSGKARLQANGDLALDDQGILDGTVTLKIAGANELTAFVAALPPDKQRLGNTAIGGLLAFGQPGTIGGKAATQLVVEIKHGRVRIGPVDVELPRLPL